MSTSLDRTSVAVRDAFGTADFLEIERRARIARSREMMKFIHWVAARLRRLPHRDTPVPPHGVAAH